MLSNPFAKHLSVTRHASMVEGLSHYKVVCFPATILTPLEIVHSVLTCSGITFFAVEICCSWRNRNCNRASITAWIVDDKRTIGLVSSNEKFSKKRLQCPGLLLFYPLSGTFINFVNILGARPTPKQRHKFLYWFSSYRNRVRFLESFCNRTLKVRIGTKLFICLKFITGELS